MNIKYIVTRATQNTPTGLKDEHIANEDIWWEKRENADPGRKTACLHTYFQNHFFSGDMGWKGFEIKCRSSYTPGSAGGPGL